MKREFNDRGAGGRRPKTSFDRNRDERESSGNDRKSSRFERGEGAGSRGRASSYGDRENYSNDRGGERQRSNTNRGEGFQRDSNRSSDRRPYSSDRGGERRSYNDNREGYGVRDSKKRESFGEDSGKRFNRPSRFSEKRTERPKFEDRSTNRTKSGFRDRKESGDRFDKPERYSSRPERSNNRFAEDRPKKKVMRSRKSQGAVQDGKVRLNQYIAHAGICSRRKADEFISAGLVSVNGKLVTELGLRVDPATDEVRYNGELLRRQKLVYILLNKPKDYLTTTDDPRERKTVMELVSKATKERVYPVGRLDRNTTGLLLLTNDGDLAEKLSHPRNNVPKIYHVELNKNFTQGDYNKLTFGLELEDGLIKPDDVSYVAGASKRELGVKIHSGKNRIVRRMFEHLGYDVVKLDRTIYANLTKKDLPRGRWRFLTDQELIQVKHLLNY